MPRGKNIKFGIRDLDIKLLRIGKLRANLIRKAVLLLLAQIKLRATTVP